MEQRGYLILTVNLDNPAFKENQIAETARLFRGIADFIEEHPDQPLGVHLLYDRNRDLCGMMEEVRTVRQVK